MAFLIRNTMAISTKEPVTLRCLSLNFIAKNIASVESLEGFPSEIAREIFNKCIDDNFKDFSNWIEQCIILRLFSEAYPKEFLISCKLTCIKTISELDYQIPIILSGLKQLDISGCSLGDSHDILPLLRTCKRLTSLSLSNNNLSYKGLRAVFGVQVIKSMKLEYLDVSANISINHIGITRYVTPLMSIDKIVVSVKLSDLKEWNTKLLCNSFRYQKLVPEKLCYFENEGWAARLIDYWHRTEKLYQRELEHQAGTSSNNRATKRKAAQNFYSKKVKREFSDHNLEIYKSLSEYTPVLYERTPTKIVCDRQNNKWPKLDDDDEYLSVLNMYQ